MGKWRGIKNGQTREQKQAVAAISTCGLSEERSLGKERPAVVSIPLAPWSHQGWAHQLLTSRSWAGHLPSLSLSFRISRRGTRQACPE